MTYIVFVSGSTANAVGELLTLILPTKGLNLTCACLTLISRNEPPASWGVAYVDEGIPAGDPKISLMAS